MIPCLLFSQKGEQLDNSSDTIFHTIDSLNQAAFNMKRSKVNQALKLLDSTKNLSIQYQYHQGLSTAYFNEAGIYQQNGFSKRALGIYQMALENSSRFQDSLNLVRINNQLAGYYAEEGKLDEALRISTEALEISIRKGNKKEIANIKNSIGLIETKRKNYPRAESLLKEALQISLKEKYVYGQKKAFFNLGLLARVKNDTATARAYFQNSLSLDMLLNDHYGMASNNLQLAEILVQQQRNSEAIELAKSAYSCAVLSGAYNLMTKTATLIRQQYQRSGDLAHTSAWQDTIISVLVTKNENETQYASNFIEIVKDKESQKLTAESEKEKANKRANSQLLIILVGSLMLVVMALMVIITFMSYRKQKYLSQRLTKQNAIIEENASSLDKLNKEIYSKNQLLEEDNRTKDKLLSIISHDLRNPITNTQTILSLINKGALTEEESKTLLEQLETQYINTTGLLDNLLGWLKSQITGKELEKSDINVYELMNGMHLEQKIALMRKRIKFINNTSSDANIMAEKEMIKIIFRNLITNAIKFTPLDGRIEISFTQDDTHSYVHIKDSGIGMSEEILQKVNAQKYFTRTGTLQEKGSGFGLILCRDLLQKQGGVLLIESAKGEGSTFTVKLPN
ncbi:MAG: tetratricopeptide repeat-containing sensor histidine kinase [Sediminibacterium sp.]